MSALSAPLIGIADTAMIGHLSEVAYLGAVSTAGVLFSILYWSMGFLRMGTTSMVSQFYGADKRRACAYSLQVAHYCDGPIGWYGCSGRCGGSTGLSPSLRERVRAALGHASIFSIRLYEAPLVLAVLTLNGFSMANAIAPLFVTFTANIVNVLGDYALIYGHWGAPEMGIVGAVGFRLGGGSLRGAGRLSHTVYRLLASLFGRTVAARSVHPNLAHQRQSLWAHALSSVCAVYHAGYCLTTWRCAAGRQCCTLAAVGIEQLCRRWVCPRGRNAGRQSARRTPLCRSPADGGTDYPLGDGYWRLFWLDFFSLPSRLLQDCLRSTLKW